MIPGILLQIIQTLVAILLAPLLLGWVNLCRAWLQGRRAPPLTQPYRVLKKLFHKDAVIAHTASPLFRFAPYMVFACMALAAGIVPTFANDLAFSPAADAIALVGVFALARVFLALAAMDIGTSFGTLGARREMLISFLAEPALLMVFFTASLISHSTALPTIVETLAHKEFVIYPSMAFAAVAFWMVSTAENARIPVDNPATHLELTMVHEAMVLEYSGRHLAMIELSVALKLLLYISMIACIFFPPGLADSSAGTAGFLIGGISYLIKLAIGGVLLGTFEMSIAKMRVFRLPNFVGGALMLGLLGVLLLFVSRGM